MRAFFRLLTLFLALILLLATAGFFARNIMLRKSLQEVSSRFHQKYGTDLIFGNACFVGMDRICINNVSLVPSQQDTLLCIDSMSFRVNFVKSVFGEVSLASFCISDATVSLVNRGGSTNYAFLMKKGEQKDTTDKGMVFYTNRLISRLFSAIPSELIAKNLMVSYAKEEEILAVKFPLLTLINGEFNGRMTLVDPHHNARFSIKGGIDKDAKRTDLALVYEHEKGEMITLLQDKWSTLFAFDSCRFAFAFAGEENGRLKLLGNLSASGFRLDNLRISSEPVSIKKANLDYQIGISNREFQLDSTSTASINDIVFHPAIQVVKSTQGKLLSMRLNMPAMAATNFFQSLPQGLFGLSRNITASGSLSYQAKLELNLTNPDSVVFVAEMKKDKLKLVPASIYPITRVNQSFDYAVYEKGNFIRSFNVGEANPDYTPLMKISELLKNCLLTSEDGAFFYHRGFNEEMFAKAIRDNIKKQRFARGASTITMQMVKNVFLNRNKTISRKLDEALLVWLIENNHLISKERILEIYLNVIEWGPGVYGIGEASRFYFAKKPADLNLEESMFLASIVPNPKVFMYAFDTDGNLKPHVAGFYRLVSGILLKRMVITDLEFANLKPNVKLKGQARDFLRKPLTEPLDSLLIEQE